MADINKPNKFTVHGRLALLENATTDLRRDLNSIQLREGKPGKDGVSITGPAGPRGEKGERGEPSTVPGPQGRPGESIKGDRGERGPAGHDSEVLLAEVRKEMAELRAKVAPLTAALHSYLEEMARSLKWRNEYMAAAIGRIQSKRK